MIHVHGDASNKSLEAGSRQKHISTLLVALDLSQSDCARLVTHLTFLFHATVGRGVLLDSLTSLADFLRHLGGLLGLRGNLRLWH